MDTLLLALVMGGLSLVVGCVFAVLRRANAVAQERRRIAYEVHCADWELRQLSRAAMQAMLDEARRAQGGPRQ